MSEIQHEIQEPEIPEKRRKGQEIKKRYKTKNHYNKYDLQFVTDHLSLKTSKVRIYQLHTLKQ